MEAAPAAAASGRRLRPRRGPAGSRGAAPGGGALPPPDVALGRGQRRRRPGPHRAGDRRRACAHRHQPGAARQACCASSCRRWSGWRTISTSSPAVEAAAREASASRSISRAMRPPHRSASERRQGHARSGRHRGQHPPGRATGARRSRSPRGVYEEARQTRLWRRQVHGRRAPHRHRRRQPCRARRRRRPLDSPVPAPAGPVEEPRALLAPPSRRCPTCSPACSSARPARHRASTRRGTTRSTNSRSHWRHAPAPAQGATPPWLVDRLLRNLLVDVTGNTHRTRDLHRQAVSRRTGRRGGSASIEFRGFEMPPDARMSLAQQLLVRALIAWFWHEPHDRSAGALGHGAARPLHAARAWSGRISATCSPISVAPATPSTRSGSRRRLEFRFPVLWRGRSMAASSWRLRQALEPWHVMGEEGAIGGTVRYVDSSVERLQVKAKGADARAPPRHLQRPPPADDARPARRATASPAVRFKAWQPASGLHPTHSRPRAADLRHLSTPGVGRSLGGCVYHVAHPGGRNYETLACQCLRGGGAAAARVSKRSAILPARMAMSARRAQRRNSR